MKVVIFLVHGHKVLVLQVLVLVREIEILMVVIVLNPLKCMCVYIYLYSALPVVPHPRGAQAWITQCYLQLHQCLPLPRKRSPDGASPDWGCGHLIAATKGTLNRTAADHQTAIRWLVHRPLMGGPLHLVQRGGILAGCGPAQYPPRCTKCNGPPINGQCINFILFDMELHCVSKKVHPFVFHNN